MLRLRMASVLAVVALLGAACGDGGSEITTPDEPQGQAPTTTGGPEDSPEADGTEASDTATDTTAAAEPDGPDEAAPADDGADAAPVDAATLLASTTTQLDGRSVRGEATFDLAPGFGLSTSFEYDAEGDLAAMIELPPGVDPEFPAGADAEFRYVGGVIYARPPVPAETLAELGVDEAWYIAEPLSTGDPFGDAMASGGGMMCIFPQSADALLAECDPLGDVGILLEGARDPEIVGREDVRGTEATRVRFQMSLMDLVGEALGQTSGEEDDGTPEGELFDESSTDPFAEGMEAFFAMLDTGFEVEVWIDDDNLIRRLAYDLASMFAGLAGPDEVIPSSLITVEFFDFDADISVEAPPPETIVDEDLLVGGDDYS
ncbi:MAG: hypothetical protein F4Z34_09540 [Acidimicrobiaceae bacterium]|nr:hypothetical protein [Acidimicrobiaceae bacterium]